MFDIQVMKDYFFELLKYLPKTIQLTVGALFIAFPVSLIFAIILIKKIKGLQAIVKIFLSLVRGTPVLLQMFVIYALFPKLLQSVFNGIGKQIDIYSVDNIWYAYLAISLFAIAFMTEAFRSSIESVDKGQAEAGCMIGLSDMQVFFRIIFPQALTVAIPILSNIVVDVIKTTSLAFTMSVTELMGEAKILGGMNTRYLEMFLDVFIIYLIFIGLVEFILKKAEQRLVRHR